MIQQLEFEELVKVCCREPPRPRGPVRPRRSLLGFVSELLSRKFKRGLSDMDILILCVLAKAPEPIRFYQVVNACTGSNTGVWNSLERMDDRGLVKTTGKPGCHFYGLTNDGIKALKYLAGK